MKLPLRLRLTLVFAVGMAIVLSAFGAFVYLRVGQDLMASVDLGLRARAQVIEGTLTGHPSAAIDATGTLIDPDESFAQILDSGGRIVQSSSAASAAPLLSSHGLMSVRGPTFFVRSIARIDTDPLRLLAVPIGSPGPPTFLVVGATLGDRTDDLRRLLFSLAVGGPALLLLISAAGWMIVRAALRPVERMRVEAAAVSASEPDRRLPVPSTGDELARLAATLNSMLDRLQQALEREHRFVDDASHELRTPLSILKMELDLALARGRTPEELVAALRNASEETDRLVRLAEDLLVLARMQHGRLPVRRTDVELRGLVEEAIAPYVDRAHKTRTTIELDVEPAIVSIDPARVRQAVENLLDNAIRHTGRNGRIKIAAAKSDGGVRIAVDDSGPGFPVDVLSTAFEPFARFGATHSGNGASHGAGLGLAIVRAVAEAHGGTAIAENRSDGGARVVVLLGPRDSGT